MDMAMKDESVKCPACGCELSLEKKADSVTEHDIPGKKPMPKKNAATMPMNDLKGAIQQPTL